MTDYQKLYVFLFNKITDAVKAIDTGDVSSARAIMIKAQQEAEEMYIEDE